MNTLSLKDLVGSVSKQGSRLGFCFFIKFVNIFFSRLFSFAILKRYLRNIIYSRLPITRTLPNSNQNRFSLDFLHSFTIILPSVIQTLDNSNLPPTLMWFLFPFISFLHKFNLDNSNHDLSSRQVEKKCTAVRNIEIILTTMYTFSLPFCFQFKYSVQNCVFIKFWSVPVACIHSPSHFLISGYLLRPPDNSNLFRLPLKIRVIGSHLYVPFPRRNEKR